MWSLTWRPVIRTLAEGGEELVQEEQRIRSILTPEEYQFRLGPNWTTPCHKRIECLNCDFKLPFNTITSSNLLPRCCISPDQRIVTYL